MASVERQIVVVRVPGMDGIDVQRRVWLERPALPTIFISGRYNAETRQRTLNRGRR